jgi:hypothetical protein
MKTLYCLFLGLTILVSLPSHAMNPEQQEELNQQFLEAIYRRDLPNVEVLLGADLILASY